MISRIADPNETVIRIRTARNSIVNRGGLNNEKSGSLLAQYSILYTFKGFGVLSSYGYIAAESEG